MDIYVGNLSYKTTEEDLKELFEPHGEIASIRIITDKKSEKSKGFGFVEMNSEDEVDKAISALTDYEFNKRKIAIRKSNKPAGGSSGRPNRAGDRRGGNGGNSRGGNC
jgi:RNA recognition motif-containing protein